MTRTRESELFRRGGAESEEEEEVLTWDGGQDGEPTVGAELSQVRKKELKELLSRHRDTLTKIPACMYLASHLIETGDSGPIRLHPYRIPHAYQDIAKKEVEEMKAQGIIEPSSSERAAPVVIVRKKDASICLCVDYRRLNAVTRADAYPMPRIDELINQLGQAQYITTLDLTKGYWQVPVTEQDEPKTAFTTPFGLYHALWPTRGTGHLPTNDGSDAQGSRRFCSRLSGLPNYLQYHLGGPHEARGGHAGPTEGDRAHRKA